MKPDPECSRANPGSTLKLNGSLALVYLMAVTAKWGVVVTVKTQYSIKIS